jgi:hypothetical protein
VESFLTPDPAQPPQRHADFSTGGAPLLPNCLECGSASALYDPRMDVNEESSRPLIVNYATPPTPIPEHKRRSRLYRLRWLILVALIMMTYLIRAFVSWWLQVR